MPVGIAITRECLRGSSEGAGHGSRWLPGSGPRGARTNGRAGAGGNSRLWTAPKPSAGCRHHWKPFIRMRMCICRVRGCRPIYIENIPGEHGVGSTGQGIHASRRNPAHRGGWNEYPVQTSDKPVRLIFLFVAPLAAGVRGEKASRQVIDAVTANRPSGSRERYDWERLIEQQVNGIGRSHPFSASFGWLHSLCNSRDSTSKP